MPTPDKGYKEAQEPEPVKSRPDLRYGASGREVDHLRTYLDRFGYLPVCTCRSDFYCKHVQNGVGQYQIFFGLPVTGVLDEATVAQLSKPRCGVPDLEPGEDARDLADDYVLDGGSWPNPDLTYFFINGTGDISGTGEFDIVRQAFSPWASVTPLSFTEVSVEADAHLRVRWASGTHGDGSPFDGFGNVLAHGFYPPPTNSQPIAGDVHFDEAEEWDNEDGGWWWWKRRDLLTVATHEIGHGLGLRHSTVSGAVMWPSYEGERRRLHADDIEGIQAIYGPSVAPAGSRFTEVSLFALKNTGGYGSVTVDLGTPQRFLAWGTITMIDSLSDFDRDNAAVVEVYQVDGVETWKAVYGGAHWGAAGQPSNVHQGAFIGSGQRVTFRLRSIHPSDLDLYGMGTVVKLGD